MLVVQRTEEFNDWLKELADAKARTIILARIDRLVLGNLGTHRPVGDGVSELKVDFGPGYRVYYTRRGNTLVVLLCGGDKSTQKRDIKRAEKLRKGLE